MNSQEIVKIIEAELKRQGIPKAKFYADVGIKSGHMSNWRIGNNDPSVKTLVKISEYLGLDLLGAKTPPAEDGEGRYGLQKRDWWGIGQWFKHELDMTARPPEYLANASGIPLDRVEAFLVGNAELSKAELEALAKALEKPLADIIHGYAAAFENEESPVDLSILIQRFGSLPPEQQRRLSHSVELLGEVGAASSHLLELFESALENQKRNSQD